MHTNSLHGVLVRARRALNILVRWFSLGQTSARRGTSGSPASCAPAPLHHPRELHPRLAATQLLLALHALRQMRRLHQCSRGHVTPRGEPYMGVQGAYLNPLGLFLPGASFAPIFNQYTETDRAAARTCSDKKLLECSYSYVCSSSMAGSLAPPVYKAPVAAPVLLVMPSRRVAAA
jgi:hypothetical protein